MPESVELIFRIQTEGQQQLDAITKAVKGISGEVRQGGQQLTTFEGSLKRTTDQAVQASRGIGSAATALQGLTSGMGLAGIAAGGITAGLAAAGKAALDLVVKYGAAADQTQKLATSLGLSVTEAQRWQAVTRLAGTGTNPLEAAAGRVAAALNDASGSGAKVIGVLRELGVNVRTSAGQTREYGIVARDAFRALSQVEDATKRYALAQRLLGTDGAKQFQPILAQYKELNDEIDRLGIGLDANVTKNLAQANNEIDKLSLAWDDFKAKLAGKIAPIVIPVIQVTTAALTRPGTAGGDLAAAGGGPVPTADTYRSVQGSLLDDSRSLFSSFGPGLGPGALEIGRTFTNVQGGLLAPPAKTKPGRTLADTRGAQIQALISSLDAQGLDPLARLIEDTENRLQALVAKYGPLTGTEQAGATGALQGAIRRQSGRIAPVSTSIDPATQGFLYGGLRTTAQTSQVNPSRNTSAQDLQSMQLAGMRQYLAYQERLIALTTGPGGELAAIEQIKNLRIEAAQREFAIKKDLLDFNRQSWQAEQDAVIAVAELRQRKLSDYKNTAGEVYDALIGRNGGGLGDMVRGQLHILQRQLFVNASAGIFEQFGGTLGRVGQASGLGGLLSGTIFDPANAQGGVVANTTATDRNTQALERNTVATASALSIGGLTGGLTGGGGGGLASLGGLFGPSGGDLMSLGIPGLGLPSGGGGNKLLGNIFSGLSSPLTAGLFSGFRGGDYSVALGNGQATSAGALGLTSTAGRVANIGASGAIAGLGALGIYQGLKQGGPRGTTQAIGSALGVAAMIPGPQQPFLQAGALIAGFVGAMLPDPKMQRAEEINRTLASSRYTETLGVDRFTDQYGNNVDYNRRGEIRVMQPVTVNVSAMDSKSFLDRADDIGSAVKRAIQGGHDVADSMRGLVFVH